MTSVSSVADSEDAQSLDVTSLCEDTLVPPLLFGMGSKWTSALDASGIDASAEDASACWLFTGDGRSKRFESLSLGFVMASDSGSSDSDARELGSVFWKLFNASFGSDEKVIGVEASCSPVVGSFSPVVLLGNAIGDCQGAFFHDGASEVDWLLAV